MPPFWTAIVAGAAAGLVASLAMNLYQGATASAFGQDRGNAHPATVKAADDASLAVGGRPVTQRRRGAAGSLVHYALGTVLGVDYALLAGWWPAATIGFGAAFGIAIALVLDDLVVPLFGWGPWPWRTGAAANAYGLSAHIVFGVVLEGVRRLATGLLGGG